MHIHFVFFLLNFGILAWGHQCKRIVKLQKKIIRISSLSKYNAHTEPIFKSLKLLKVKNILKLHELKFSNPTFYLICKSININCFMRVE